MNKKNNFSHTNNKDKNMTKANYQNEKIKRKYYNFLKESQGYSKSSIESAKKAIYRYEEFSSFEDFGTFNKNKAIDFKQWLETKPNPKTKEPISITTAYHYIRNLQSFFKWLAYQASYKSRICLTDVEYLKLPKEKARIAIAKKREHYPTLEQFKKFQEFVKKNGGGF